MIIRQSTNCPELSRIDRPQLADRSMQPRSRMILLASLLAANGLLAQVVDPVQFAPDPELRPYSVYATDSIYLPPNSGTATGGSFGSGGGVVLGSGNKLRSPYVSVRRNFSLAGVWQDDTTAGGLDSTRSRINVDGVFQVTNRAVFRNAVQVQGVLRVSNNDIAFQDSVLAHRLQQEGTRNAFRSLVQVRDSFLTNGQALFPGAGARVRMAGAAGTFSGQAPPANFQSGILYPAPAPMGTALVKAPADLPGHTIAGYLAPATLPAVNAVAGNSHTGSIRREGSGLSDTTLKTFNCMGAPGLGATYCDGDTLKPGYYGALTLDDNDVSLILGEGFYSFTSIRIGSSSNIVSVQPNGARTFVHSVGVIDAYSSGTFIGPADAFGATGYGTDSGKFLGGTFMLIGSDSITLASDMERDNGGGIWATVSAPRGSVRLGSQVEIFGQIFARRVIGNNNIDFGQGAYIPFDPEVPVITIQQGLDMVITEAGPSGPDALGRRYLDTLLSVELDKVNAFSVGVDWRISDGTAIWNKDHGTPGNPVGPQSGTLVIPKGTTKVTLALRIYDDTVYTGTRRFSIILDNPTNAKFSTGLPADTIGVTILDDELPVPEISFATATRSGVEGIGTDSISVVLSSISASAVTVSYGLGTGSTATAGADFATPAGVLTIPAGVTTAKFPLAILQDLLDESNETVVLVLSNPNRAILGTITSHVYTILDDDAPPTVGVDSLTVNEPATDSLRDSVVIRLSSPSGLNIDVVWRTSDATAIAGTNYRASSATSVRIPAGATSVKVPVVILPDGRDSDDKFFRVILSAPVNATLGKDSGIVLIRDTDPTPSLSIDSVSLVEPPNGKLPMVFQVRLSSASDKRVVVRWSTSDLTATAGFDYEAGSDSLVFLPGQTQKTIPVQILSDNLSGEGTEDFRVTLASPVNATLRTPIGLGSIREGRGEPILTLTGAATFVEADTLVSFHIHLSNPSASQIVLTWRTVGGTAIPDLDFKDTSGTIVLAPGKMDTTFQVRIIDDKLRETIPETFQVTVSGDLNVVILQPSVTDTILDDNDSPDLRIEDSPNVTEGGDAVFRVTLANITTDTIRVVWATVAGTATSPADYQGTTLDTLVFVPGQTSLEISIPTYVDSIWEPSERFQVAVLSAPGAILVDSIGSVVLLEEGPIPTLSWRTRDTSVTESVGSVALVAELSRPASVRLAFAVEDRPGTALVPADAFLVQDSAVFPPLARFSPLSLTVVDDTLDEFDESLTLVLLPGTLVTVVSGDPLRVTILDDDAPPAVRFAADTLRRPEDAGRVTFNLSLERASAKDITVWIKHTGTATPGLDHDLVAGDRIRVFFPAGSLAGSFQVGILEDRIDEPDETVAFRIDSLVNAEVGDSALLIILDNDAPPVVSFANPDTTVLESVGKVRLEIVLDRPSASVVTMGIRAGGTTTLGGARPDVLVDSFFVVTFQPGETSLWIVPEVVGDGRVEPTERLTLTPVQVQGSNGAPGGATTITILDDDRNPDVVITGPRDSLKTKDSSHVITWTWDGNRQPPTDTTIREGWNIVIRCATDTAGNTGCDTIRVWADFTPPVVTITVPVPEIFLTNKPDVRICWTVLDSGATWRRFDSTCVVRTLPEGRHVDYRIACDEVGNCHKDSVIIIVDLTPPKGVFVFPPDSARIRVRDQPALIRWIDDEDTIWVPDTLQMKNYGWNTFTATYTDKAGNVGTTQVHLYFEAPQVQGGWYVDTDGDGKVDAAIVEFDAPWLSDTLPSFQFDLGSERRTAITPKGWYTEGTRGVPAVDKDGRVVRDAKGDTVYLLAGIPMLDKDGKPVLDSITGKVLTSPVGSVWRDADGKVVYDASGRELYRVAGPGTEDRTRMVVPLPDPFKYGVTSVDPNDSGRISVTLPLVDSTGRLVTKPIETSFAMRDSVPAIIAKAVVERTEVYYKDGGRDKLYITPSEPIVLDSTGNWLEIKVDGIWYKVDPDSIFVTEDGRIWMFIPPGRNGSPQPGVEVRFLGGVSDTSGNGTKVGETKWTTVVEGPPRPPVLALDLPTPVKSVPSEESRITRPGGFVLRATRSPRGDTARAGDPMEWWKSGYGYTTASDPDISRVCPDLRYCNGVQLFVNRPVRMLLFIYDLSGTYVVDQEINLTQADIESFEADELDRVRIEIQWNMRSKPGQVVASGIYLWRIVSWVSQPDGSAPIMTNQIVKVGVKSSLK